jgi:hypothetical protein
MNWDHIYMLLVVVEKCTGHPKLAKIMQMALDELQMINDQQTAGTEEEEHAA